MKKLIIVTMFVLGGGVAIYGIALAIYLSIASQFMLMVN